MSKKLQLDKAAESIASMVIEWVEGGIKMGTDWRSGLSNVIQLRLDRVDAISQLAALREELAEIKESTSYRGSLLGRTDQRLADAERRNELLEKILRNGRHLGGAGWQITVEAALNPKPEDSEE